MPVSFGFADEDDLLILNVTGLFLPDQLRQTLAQIAETDAFSPAMDRLVVIDAATDMSEMTPAAVKAAVQSVQHLLSERNPQEGTIAFRSAFVSENDLNQAIAKLFFAFWAGNPDFEPTYRLFDTVEDALAWLGRSDLDVGPYLHT